MTQILELSDREFKVTLISMLRTLMEKVDNVQEWINISRVIQVEKWKL